MSHSTAMRSTSSSPIRSVALAAATLAAFGLCACGGSKGPAASDPGNKAAASSASAQPAAPTTDKKTDTAAKEAQHCFLADSDASEFAHDLMLVVFSSAKFTPKRITKASTSENLKVMNKVATEAASLLYFGQEKEYKQAKVKAAQNLGVHVLPSNIEVALELDQIAEETEGPARKERLLQMRTEGLEIMKMLASYCPILIGSVWRGTIRRGSDIDIEAYSDEPEKIVAELKADGFAISKTQRMTVTEHGETGTSFHIHTQSSTKNVVEIVIRSSEEAGKKRVCDTFGDQIKGLNIQTLQKLLKENGAQCFLP